MRGEEESCLSIRNCCEKASTLLPIAKIESPSLSLLNFWVSESIALLLVVQSRTLLQSNNNNKMKRDQIQEEISQIRIKNQSKSQSK
jgi:hypothetical protein